MKKKNLWLVILAIMLVFAMTVVGCGDDSTGDNDNNGGGGGDPIKAKFVGTEWENVADAKLGLKFMEVTSGGMAGQGLVNLNFLRNGSISTYYQITKFEADKFITSQSPGSVDYTLSSDGKTLTLPNVGYMEGSNWTGTYTKQ